MVTANKTALTPVSVRGEDSNDFISRRVEVTYTCRRQSTSTIVEFYACVALAKEDEETAQLKDVDVRSESWGKG